MRIWTTTVGCAITWNRWSEQAKEQGYVETIFGRRRYLPELELANFNLRASASGWLATCPFKERRRMWVPWLSESVWNWRAEDRDLQVCTDGI